ncbi:MAG: SEC-C domain-containing protein [Bacteroidales bacterium]|nr:SEC-C domain-containing protein [Bacteroidales bacterium]
MNSLADRLTRFEKWELEDFMDVLGADVPDHSRKTAIIKCFTAYLSRKPEFWLRHLMERDLRLLSSLVKAGPGKMLAMDHPDYPTILEITGIVENDSSDDYDLKLWISQEVFDIVSPHIEKVISDCERSGQFTVERACLGLMNLYGVVPYAVFCEKLAVCLVDMGLKQQEIWDLLELTPVLRWNSVGMDDMEYMCSPLVENIYDVLDARKKYAEGISEYADFSPEEIISAGSGAPFFIIGDKSEAGKAMRSMLSYLGYSGPQIATSFHDVWMDAQFPDDNQHVFDIVNDVSDSLSISRYSDFIKVISGYVNSTPKWILSGFSADETGMLRIEAEIGDEQVEDIPDDAPKWVMPSPSVSDGYALPSGFPFGLSVPHVAPGDPCPCGSGLKYRSCHGKYPS